MRAWRWAVPVVTCALVAGCTSTVTGSAVAGPVITTPAAPRRTTTDCSGGTVIQPKGAPYCYLLPSGFNDATGQLTLSYQSASSKYESAVAIAVHDAIIVAVYPLRENSDDLSAGELSDQVSAVLGKGESTGGFTVAGDPTPATVDDARAFRTTVKQNDGQYAGTIYFVFLGYTEVEINCQYAAKQADINRGCASVRQSIQIIDPPK
jgi:hypothetical protein